ncbi:hypothetical protein QO002_003165 [Pararhizobium capsulatum DSM 1112]|uniref:Uncharacterized protein n=1 Tax=Pararhizobium capsulatum DSM 1112 TaxID=1121113 RepID=A0ABU0BRY9_9HYPH|nr:hypothetical protein [Pararhizobium capsulatum]MDQ0321027.1 hypothetical protein [Pararhizobium capsulatum DSM 1112]
MIWIIPALAGILIVYFAMRSSRFRRFAEPVLSVFVAIGLMVAFVIWLTDDNSNSASKPTTERPAPLITPEQLVLEGLGFERNGTDLSFRATGSVRNTSGAFLDYFKLTAILEDCAETPCRLIGEDTALILARVPPGESQSISTFFTFPNRLGPILRTPRWTTRIDSVSGHNL